MIPNPVLQTITSGVTAELAPLNALGDLWAFIVGIFRTLPDETLDGGDDKHFFAVEFKGIKLFVAENEVGGLTVMLPEEY